MRITDLAVQGTSILRALIQSAKLRQFLPAFFVLAVVTSCPAAITFSFTYTDGTNVGFNSTSQGATRKTALNQAASIVGSLFGSYNATINMEVDGSETTNGVLAAAGSNFNSSPGTGFNDRGDVMLKILGGNGADPAIGTADGSVTFNFQDQQWEYGTSFQAGEYDFISTAVHELLHAVGFSSSIAEDGSDYYGNSAGDAGIYAPFDRYVNGPSGSIIDSGTFKLDITRWNSAKVGGHGTTNGLRFVGPNAMVANGGLPIYLYSPSSWEEGSSGSHIDDDRYHGLYIMEAAADTGLGIRTIGSVERAMLKDMGYTLIAVPEPGVLWLLASSVGLLGFRRRQKHQ